MGQNQVAAGTTASGSIEQAAQVAALLHQAFAAMQGGEVQPQMQGASIAEANTSIGKVLSKDASSGWDLFVPLSRKKRMHLVLTKLSHRAGCYERERENSILLPLLHKGHQMETALQSFIVKFVIVVSMPRNGVPFTVRCSLIQKTYCLCYGMWLCCRRPRLLLHQPT